MLTKLNNSNSCQSNAVIDKKITDLQNEVDTISDNVTALTGDVAQNASDIQDLQTCVASGIFDNISGDTIDARNGVITDKIAPNLNDKVCVYGGIETPEVDTETVDTKNLIVNCVPFTSTLNDIQAANANANCAKSIANAAVCNVSCVEARVDAKLESLDSNVTTCCVAANEGTINTLTTDAVNVTCELDTPRIEVTEIVNSIRTVKDSDKFVEPTAKTASDYYLWKLPKGITGRYQLIGVDNNDIKFSIVFDSNNTSNTNGMNQVTYAADDKSYVEVIAKNNADNQLFFVSQADITRLYVISDTLDTTDVPDYEIYPSLSTLPAFSVSILTTQPNHTFFFGNETSLDGGVSVCGRFDATLIGGEGTNTEFDNIYIRCNISLDYDPDNDSYCSKGKDGGIVSYANGKPHWVNDGCPRTIVRKSACCCVDELGCECSVLEFENVTHSTTEFTPTETSDKLFDETTLANYKGRVSDGQVPATYKYPITNLGDCTCVHGDLEIAGIVTVENVCSTNNLNILVDCAVQTYADSSYESLTGEKQTSACNVTVNACEFITNCACCGFTICSPDTVASGRLEAKGDIRSHQSIIAEEDLVVHGDLYVDGTTTSSAETQVATTGDFIVTRESNNTPMSSGDYSGLVVNNYASGKMATITANYCGEWRISDSATSTATTYTNISNFNGNFYSGLTQTATTGPTHIMTNVDMIELSEVVLDSNNDYYHHNGNDWYGPISVVGGLFDLGSIVESASKITELDALTKSRLVYFNTVTDNAIDASTNQPLLTRDEATHITGCHLLMWDSTNKRAVDSGIVSCVNAGCKTVVANCFDGKLKGTADCATCATNASCAVNACKVYKTMATANTNRQVLLGEGTEGTSGFGCVYVGNTCKFTFNPSNGLVCAKSFCGSFCGSIANSTCFNGCTYACAKADFLKAAYPVGSVYMNKTCSCNPGTLLGVGTWTQITDRFLIARGTTYTSYGGSSTVTLSACHLPNHCHSGTVGSHSHTINDPGHTHSAVVGTDSGNRGGTYSSVPVGVAWSTGSNTTGISINSTQPSFTGCGMCSGGNSCSFSIIPPYCAVYTWYRCA